MHAIKLLSTDFDGTLVDHLENPPVDPRLFELIRELQKRGTLWAINTGRALKHIVDGLAEFQFPVQPDFVLTCEREVFRRTANGEYWEDYGDWNERCTKAHAELFASVQPFLESISEFLRRDSGTEIVVEDGTPVGLIAATEKQMDRAVAFIESHRANYPGFFYQRNTMYMRFCHEDYHKGAALGELARLKAIPRSHILAVGDHYNDLSMLDGRFAGMNCCPGNSIPEVKKTVRAAGGYIARAGCSRGVIEALEYFASSKIQEDA
jgi:HAD superfamily hydrolase (TIGR01484 family)